MSDPVPYQQPGDIWARFSADPRTTPTFRASDADRDVVVGALAAAFQDGRLDASEHEERLSRALAAKQLGELEPLVSDISVAPVPQPAAPAAEEGPKEARHALKETIRAWVLVAVITNVIWLVSMIAGAAGWVYYWPVWPMLGMGIPVLITLLYGESQGRSQRQLEDERRRRERRDRRRLDP